MNVFCTHVTEVTLALDEGGKKKLESPPFASTTMPTPPPPAPTMQNPWKRIAT